MSEGILLQAAEVLSAQTLKDIDRVRRKLGRREEELAAYKAKYVSTLPHKSGFHYLLHKDI